MRTFTKGSETPKPVGFWSGGYPSSPDLPSAEDCVDPSWDPEERAEVALYLESAKVSRSYRGFSDCRICGKMNGSREHTDGEWYWPSGFSHYLREHDVRPPQEFIDHVKSR